MQRVETINLSLDEMRIIKNAMATAYGVWNARGSFADAKTARNLGRDFNSAYTNLATECSGDNETLTMIITPDAVGK